MNFFFFSSNQGERSPFIGKGRPLSLVNFLCGIVSHKGRNPKPPNLGNGSLSPLSTSNVGLSPTKEEILSLQIWGLHC